MSKYYCSEYCDIISDVMDKKKWIQVYSKEDDIKFSYSNSVVGDFMLASDEEIEWMNEINTVNSGFHSHVKIYAIIVHSSKIFIYKEGKVYRRSSTPRFFTSDKYYNTIFYDINKKIYEIMKPKLERNPHKNNTFKIVTLDFGIDNESVELISIEKYPDLSKECDMIDKMKLHYWLLNDLIYLFVFNNKYGHRWYECNDITKSTYHVNTSRILREVLDMNGYVEAKTGSKSNFSSWDTYKTKNVSSDISIIPGKITYKMDDKIYFYKTLLKHDMDSYCPKTYIQLKDIEYNSDKIYFLKSSGSSGGRGVHVVNSKKMVDDIMTSHPGVYLLQEEVPNLKLINNKKFTLRCYVLLTDTKEIFLHKNILCIHHGADYSPTLDRNIHIDHKIHKYSNYSNDEVFLQLQDLFFNVCCPFIKDELLEDQYIILGADILLDNNNKPYIIEINTFPNMQYDDKKVEYVIKKEMFSDFLNLYVNPKIKRTVPAYGKWCLCNPLFEDTHFQFKFKEVYLENLFKNEKDYDYKKVYINLRFLK